LNFVVREDIPGEANTVLGFLLRKLGHLKTRRKSEKKKEKKKSRVEKKKSAKKKENTSSS
jgi:hypothetical protein